MKVLVVAPLYHPDRGGLGKQAVLLTERLASLGVRPLVATRAMEGLPERDAAADVEVVSIRAGRPRVHNYERKNLVNLLTSLRFSAGLVGAMLRRRASYDVVHFHGASLPLIVALPCAKLLGKPVVAKVAAVGQGVEAGDLKRRYGPLGRALAWGLGHVDAFVATTDEIGEALRGEGYAQVERIPNFVDTHRYRASSSGSREETRAALGFEGRTVVLFCGRLEARKDVGSLMEAFARAAERCADAEPLLVIVGDGPQRAALEEQASSLGLGERVRFVGFRSDPWRWLSAADVLALPSLVEGLPNALLEAMACGLPVVATRLGGIGEALGDAGLLVPPRDPGALADALAELLGDPERRRALGEAAARRITEGFTLDAIAPRYLDLYRRLA